MSKIIEIYDEIIQLAKEDIATDYKGVINCVWTKNIHKKIRRNICGESLENKDTVFMLTTYCLDGVITPTPNKKNTDKNCIDLINEIEEVGLVNHPRIFDIDCKLTSRAELAVYLIITDVLEFSELNKCDFWPTHILKAFESYKKFMLKNYPILRK